MVVTAKVDSRFSQSNDARCEGMPRFGAVSVTDNSNEVLSYNHTLEGGCIHVGDSPGLGVDFSEDAAAKYPYNCY